MHPILHRSRRASWLLGPIALLGLTLCLTPGCREDKVFATPSLALAEVAERYGIEIQVASDPSVAYTSHGPIECGPSQDKYVQAYAQIFAGEFGRYSDCLIALTRIKRVILCTNLSFDGQKRSAVPDFRADDLYLDVEAGMTQNSYQREVIHHEIFHVIDLRDDGELYGDDDWAALNPSSFQYGNGGINAQDIPNSGSLTDQYPGFLNHYSTMGVEEDKAEVYANLLVFPSFVKQRIKVDPVLLSKTLRMKELVAELCPEHGESFWE